MEVGGPSRPHLPVQYLNQSSTLKNAVPIKETFTVGSSKSSVAIVRFAELIGLGNLDSSGDRQGTSVNFASRIEGAKTDQFHQTRLGITKADLEEANRILVSEVLNDELKSEPGFKTRLVGYFDFKGISGRHRVYELQWK